ncbi:MAG: hypothetical protein ACRES2_05030 [Steroidobacteraceae bacterium]
MDTAIDIKACWQQGKTTEGTRAVTDSDLRSITASRVRKQFKTVAGFVWASLVHQIILYSFLSYTLVRNWGNVPVMLLSLAGAAVYVPLTAALLRRARTLYSGGVGGETGGTVGAAPSDIAQHVRAERDHLADFFRFKRRMDFIGVPVSCAIVVFVTFTLFVSGGVTAYPLASVGVFAAWVAMSVAAVRAENRKRFGVPLTHLDAVIEDLGRTA